MDAPPFTDTPPYLFATVQPLCYSPAPLSYAKLNDLLMRDCNHLYRAPMFLTKLVSALLSPLSLVLIAVVVAGLLWLLQRRRGAGYSLGVALALFLVFSSEPFARWILMPLEARYEPLREMDQVQDVRWVLVLGSGASDMAEYPATTRLTGVASLRLTEGLRIHRELPESTLVLSGGTVFGDEPSATVMSRAAVSLGADLERIRIHPNPRNTYEEARLVWEAIGDEPFILVTSASHMPRAMLLTRKAGVNPIPAPTAIRTATTRSARDPAYYLPSASALEMTERAFHEYMGIAWAWLRGQI